MQFDVPSRIAAATPDPGCVARIRENLTKSVAPIRPLPSNLSMTLWCVAIFCGLAVLLTIPVGFKGFAKLSLAGAIGQYSVVLLLALVMAGGVVAQMIPGSRQVLSPVAAIILAILLLSLTAALLFPDFGTDRFAARGYPCLRLGVLCAIPAAGAVWAVMRRGFVTDSVSAAMAGGGLAGLLGIGVLTLHCPIFSAAHIIGWHVAVIAVTTVTGGFMGALVSRWRWQGTEKEGSRMGRR